MEAQVSSVPLFPDIARWFISTSSALTSEHVLKVTVNILVPKCGLASAFALVSPSSWNLCLPGFWSMDLKHLLILFFLKGMFGEG